MATNTDTIRAYFLKLGLLPEVADIYLALHTYGPQTISELARRAAIERTRIYRMMDELTSSGLIEVETQYKRSILRAAPITNLQILISKKEQDIHDLRAELTDISAALAHDSLHSPTTRIQLYQGPDAIKQMLWNQTKSSSENIAILYENMQNRTKLSFFERWVEACNQRNLQFRGIIGDHFIETQQQWYGRHSNERLASWQARYIPASVLPITHSTVVYDNTTAYYNWKDGEIFGVEIINPEIATSQRQFFEMLWAQSRDVDDVRGTIENREGAIQ